jgi:hypothetical protein
MYSINRRPSQVGMRRVGRRGEMIEAKNYFRPIVFGKCARSPRDHFSVLRIPKNRNRKFFENEKPKIAQDRFARMENTKI